jgi:CO dehydrogenase nickel-insertion accessory protein CooC1
VSKESDDEATKMELVRIETEASLLRQRHEAAARQLAAQQADEDAKLSSSLGLKLPTTSAADTMLDSYEVRINNNDHNANIGDAMEQATSALSMNLMQQMMAKKRGEARAAQIAVLKAKQQRALTEANQQAEKLKQEAQQKVILFHSYSQSVMKHDVMMIGWYK